MINPLQRSSLPESLDSFLWIMQWDFLYINFIYCLLLLSPGVSQSTKEKEKIIPSCWSQHTGEKTQINLSK